MKMSKNQKIVLKYLKHAYSSQNNYPIFLIGEFNAFNTFGALPKNVKDAHDTLYDIEEAQIIIAFGEWVLKHA